MAFHNYGKPNSGFDSFFRSPHSAKSVGFRSISSTGNDIPFCLIPLTAAANCAIIYPLKAVMKTCAKVRFPERALSGERCL